MESTLLNHSIFQQNKIKSEKYCLDIISNTEFRLLLFKILNSFLKKKINKNELHIFSFVFYVKYFNKNIKINHGQFETLFIGKSLELYTAFKKLLKYKIENNKDFEIKLLNFKFLYESYMKYYHNWKYESNYYLFTKYIKIYETVNFNIKILNASSNNIVNINLLKYCNKIKNSFLKEFKKFLPDFKEYYKEFRINNIKKINTDYSYILLATTYFYKHFLNDLKNNNYVTLKLLNKDILARLDKLYPDNKITFNLNNICTYLKNNNFKKVNDWINQFYDSISESIDIKFKTNYNIWKLKSVDLFNNSNLCKLVCLFYQFLHDEISIIEENRKMTLLDLDVRSHNIMV